MSLKVWKHGTFGEPEELATDLGAFKTDQAYLVLRSEAPQQLSVWTGSQASKEATAAAAEHAGQLMSDLDDGVQIRYELQGQECEEFVKLFESLSYDTPASGTAEVGEDAEEDTDNTGIGTDATNSTVSKKKKKKKRNKGNGNNNNVGGAAPGGGAEAAAPEPVPEGKPADAIEEIPEAVMEPPADPACEGPTPAEPAEGSSPVVPSLDASPPDPEQNPAVGAPLQPAAPALVSEPTNHSPPVPSPVPLVSPVAITPTPAKTAAVKSHAAPNQPASAVSPVATMSYLADSAKAWGGIFETSPAVSVKGSADRIIPYEELKVLRDNAIDMTSKELYLSDEEFIKVFKKDRAAFLAQPRWRQQLQKKEVGLW